MHNAHGQGTRVWHHFMSPWSEDPLSDWIHDAKLLNGRTFCLPVWLPSDYALWPVSTIYSMSMSACDYAMWTRIMPVYMLHVCLWWIMLHGMLLFPWWTMLHATWHVVTWTHIMPVGLCYGLALCLLDYATCLLCGPCWTELHGKLLLWDAIV